MRLLGPDVKLYNIVLEAKTIFPEGNKIQTRYFIDKTSDLLMCRYTLKGHDHNFGKKKNSFPVLLFTMLQ